MRLKNWRDFMRLLGSCKRKIDKFAVSIVSYCRVAFKYNICATMGSHCVDWYTSIPGVNAPGNKRVPCSLLSAVLLDEK